MTWLEERAPAKVNLDLVVHGRREDGFHELSTFMVQVGLADVLRGRTSTRAGISLTLGGPQASEDIPDQADNLVVQAAARALAILAATGKAPAGLELELDKHVPSGAGLGGGSSDAAAAIRLVERLAGRELSSMQRVQILASLGSDTVFFEAARHTGAGRCEGRGDRVRALAGPSGWYVVLVVPDLVVPTGPVFQALAAPLLEGAPPPVDSPPWEEQSAEEARGILRNDLTEAACRAEPRLAAWREALAEFAPGHFTLSGSGSTFFAPCAGAAEANALLAHVEESLPTRALEARLLAATPVGLHAQGGPR